MVVWGGLRPIASQVVYDVLDLVGFSYSTFTRVQYVEHETKEKRDEQRGRRFLYNGWVLMVSCVWTVLAAGNLTNRWTLSFPMIPLVILQASRRTKTVQHSKGLRYLIQGLCILCVVAATQLCILFPAVELPPPSGPYHVGTVDVHIPALRESGDEEKGLDCSHLLPIRILYPTLDAPSSWFKPKYLNPATALDFCRETMRFGAPPPLKEYDWMLHTWRLTTSHTQRNATLLPGKLPIVVFSHGLGGNADIYSYQTMSLASRGNVVVVLNHLDGSGPFVRTNSGKQVSFDFDTPALDYQLAEKVRRNQTNLRVQEVLAATHAIVRLNQAQSTWTECQDADNLYVAETLGLNFVNRLDTNHVTVMGHSFGGVTAITAATRRPELYHAVIAHEPATRWMPVDARRSFFAKSRLYGLDLEHSAERLFNNDDDEYETNSNQDKEPETAAHEVDMLLLFSHQWRENGWGSCRLVEEMHQKGRLGPEGGVAHFSFIDQAHHNEFSDTCMLTPVWLARSVGVTGARNPLDTALEIHERTMSFLNETRKRHGVSLPP